MLKKVLDDFIHRKMKNRVAAQATHERRKAHTNRLEHLVAELKSQKQKLIEENTLLHQAQHCPHCSALSTSATLSAQSVMSDSAKSESTSKSAVLNGQQKEELLVNDGNESDLCKETEVGLCFYHHMR